jgi:tetratricopeptide (TPR) repeat protein
MPAGLAPDRPSECARALDAHAAHYAELLQRVGPQLQGAGLPDAGRAQSTVLHTLGLEFGNISVALSAALAAGKAEWLSPMARYLWRYLDIASAFRAMRQNYRRLVKEARRLSDPALGLWSQLGLARAGLRLGDYVAAGKAARGAHESAVQLNDVAAQVAALVTRGVIERDQGHYAAARELFAQALPWAAAADASLAGAPPLVDAGQTAALGATLTSYARSLAPGQGGRRYWEAHTLEELGLVGYDEDEEAATGLAAHSTALTSAELDTAHVEVDSLNHIGNLIYVGGEHTQAQALFSRALLLSRRLGNRSVEAQSLNNLGLVASAGGDLGLARALHALSLVLCRELGNRLGEAVSLHNLGGVEYAQGNYGAARELFGLALAGHSDLGDSAGMVDAITCAGAVLAAEGNWTGAALALRGGQQQADALAHGFDPEDLRIIDAGRLQLDNAIASGVLTCTALAQCDAQLAELNLPALVRKVLGRLGTSNGSVN